jgi:hypothetical protein
MGESWWTLPMAVAWIAWRDPEEVLNYQDAYRVECLDWHFRTWRIGFDGPIYKGHFLEARPSATLSSLFLADCYKTANGDPGETTPRAREAQGRLWKALQENLLQATGIPTDGDQRKPISDYEWRDLQLVEERGKDVVRTGALSANGYNEISFRRLSILALWPVTRSLGPELKLPATVKPDGPGFFPLYCAAQWIATEGGTCDFDPTNTSIWDSAYSELTAHIASGHVKVTGIRNGIREIIDGYIFASLRVDHPFADPAVDLILSNDLYLCSYSYVDDEHWRNGFDDSLRTRSGPEWSKLMVLKSEIAGVWPFLIEAQDQPSTKTGAPGRPTPMHLVVAEHLARLKSGKSEMGVVAESERLANWLKKTHPNLPPITSKTIRNKISAAHRLAGQSLK